MSGCDTCRWFVTVDPGPWGDCWRYPTIVPRPSGLIARGCGEWRETQEEALRLKRATMVDVKRRETATPQAVVTDPM